MLFVIVVIRPCLRRSFQYHLWAIPVYSSFFMTSQVMFVMSLRLVSQETGWSPRRRRRSVKKVQKMVCYSNSMTNSLLPNRVNPNRPDDSVSAGGARQSGEVSEAADTVPHNPSVGRNTSSDLQSTHISLHCTFN